MKKLLILFTALLLLTSLQGQILRYSNYTPINTTKIEITDNFQSYSAGYLAGQGNWVYCINHITVEDQAGDKIIFPNENLAIQGVKRSETFNNNQYAELTIDKVSAAFWIGPAVRLQGTDLTSNFYFYSIDGNNRIFVAVINGVFEIVAQSTEDSVAGAILRLEANGNTFTCYYNGAVDTTMGAATAPATGNNGVYTDTRITGGTPGVGGYATSSNATGDDWEGGDL